MFINVTHAWHGLDHVLPLCFSLLRRWPLVDFVIDPSASALARWIASFFPRQECWCFHLSRRLNRMIETSNLGSFLAVDVRTYRRWQTFLWHRSLWEALHSGASCSMLTPAFSPWMALRLSPTLAFEVLECAYDAWSMVIVFETPFLSMASVCCWTLMMRNSPSTFGIRYCYKLVYPFYLNSSSPRVEECQQTTTLPFWRPEFCVRIYRYVVFSILRRGLSIFNVFISREPISPVRSYAIFWGIHFKISLMVSPTRREMLLLQADGKINRDWTGRPRRIEEPECSTHPSATGQINSSYFGVRLHDSVGTRQ